MCVTRRDRNLVQSQFSNQTSRKEFRKWKSVSLCALVSTMNKLTNQRARRSVKRWVINKMSHFTTFVREKVYLGMHEINKICSLKSSRSPLEDDAEKNFKNFGKFSFEHFIRSPARKRSTLFCRPFWTLQNWYIVIYRVMPDVQTRTWPRTGTITGPTFGCPWAPASEQWLIWSQIKLRRKISYCTGNWVNSYRINIINESQNWNWTEWKI